MNDTPENNDSIKESFDTSGMTRTEQKTAAYLNQGADMGASSARSGADMLRNALLGKNFKAPDLSLYQNESDYYQQILNGFLNIRQDRDSIYKEIEQFRNYYFVTLALDVICDDVLTDSNTGSVIDVSSDIPELDKELKRFMEEFDVVNLIEDILPEMLLYGEYALGTTVESGKGIIEIVDSVTPSDFVALYDSQLPRAFWIRDADSFKVAPVRDFAHFCINSRKLRVDSAQRAPKDLKMRSPFYRIGRSVIWSGIDKLKELMLLEKVSAANSVSSLTRPNIIGLSLPNSTAPNELVDITKRYENMLNANSRQQTSAGMQGANPMDKLSGMIQDSSRVKVVPIFSDKGQLDKVDLNQGDKSMDLLPLIRDYREVAATALGIPSELLFGEVGNRRAALKQYARYSRKITTIQRAITRGLQQLCLNHLVNKFQDTRIRLSDVKVDMRSNLSVDELSNLEGIELQLSSINELHRLAQEMYTSDLNMKHRINGEAFANYVKSALGDVGFRYDFIYAEGVKEPEEPNDDDDSGY